MNLLDQLMGKIEAKKLKASKAARRPNDATKYTAPPLTAEEQEKKQIVDALKEYGKQQKKYLHEEYIEDEAFGIYPSPRKERFQKLKKNAGKVLGGGGGMMAIEALKREAKRRGNNKRAGEAIGAGIKNVGGLWK